MDRLKALSLITVVLAAVIVVAAQSPKAKDVSTPFSIAIRLPAAAVKAGSTVKVDLTLTNTSSAPATLEGKFVIPYNIEVRYANGVLVVLTDEGKEWKRSYDVIDTLPTAGANIDLEPGASIEQNYAVNKLYDMSKPGIYKIQFHLNEPGRTGVTHSNVVTCHCNPIKTQ